MQKDKKIFKGLSEHPAFKNAKLKMSSFQLKIPRQTKKHENMTHKWEKINKYKHTEMTKMMEVVTKDFI